MTYYGGKELASAFRTVRGNTLKMAEEIPEDKYGFQAAPDTRSIGKLLVHIALGPTFQEDMQKNKETYLAAVDFSALVGKVTAEESKTRNKAETIALLKS